MARDVDIATALSGLISGHGFSKAIDCEFLYDQYIEGESVDLIKVRVSIEADVRTRESRGSWHRSCVVSVVLLAPQQVNTSADVDANAEITSLLDLWDEILDFVQAQVPAGKPAVEISSFDGTRYDKDKLHSDRQFRAGVAVTYKLI